VIVTLLVVASYFAVQLLLAPSSRSGEVSNYSAVERLINAPDNSVLFVYPESNKSRAKLVGVQYPSQEDYAFCELAGGILFGMTKSTQLSTTDSTAYVDHQSGKPQFDGAIVIMGSSQVNAAALHYEQTGQTALLLAQDTSSMFIQNRTGTVLESTRVDKNTLNGSSSEIFVVETFKDTDGRRVVFVWGYAGRGAIAAARFVKFNIIAHPEDYTSGFYVGRWTDAKEGGSKNGFPDQGDTYEVLLSGASAPSETGIYSVGWMEVGLLFLAALVLVGVAYTVRKGWIRLEVRTD
jgi:hypothetical protein